MHVNENTKILTIGWSCRLIQEIIPKVQKNTNLNFAHFLYPKDYYFLKNHKINDFELYKVNKNLKHKINYKFLEDLEKGSKIKFNNIILSDRVLREKKTDEAYWYISNIAEQMYDYTSKLSPLYLLGSWDAVIQGVGMLVAKKLNIPFVIFKFSVIPRNHLSICTYPNNYDEIPFTLNTYSNTYSKAKNARDKWINGLEKVPAYESSKTFFDIIRKLPIHINEVISHFIFNLKFGRNSFVYPTFLFLLKQFLRKKSNILLMNKTLFVNDVPNEKFVFYGLHMQPESSIDVMAPFYSNQLEIVKSISRAAPINYKVLVKIHISDADNYSPKQLKEFLNIPNVSLVSPFVGSKEFIMSADLLISIQGTIALEGALLGKPVIVFGNSAYLKFSSVKKVNIIEDLPLLVEKQLAMDKVADEQILVDYTNLLLNYLPSCSDDWPTTLSSGLSNIEEKNYTSIFDQLTTYINDGKFKYS